MFRIGFEGRERVKFRQYDRDSERSAVSLEGRDVSVVITSNIEHPLVGRTLGLNERDTGILQGAQHAIVVDRPFDAQEVLILDGVDKVDCGHTLVVVELGFDVVDLRSLHPQLRNDHICTGDDPFEGH